jgi:hypothetical protein
MKKTTLAILAALSLAVSASALRAEDPNKLSIMGGSGPIKDELTPEVKTAVKKGLDWLAKTQAQNGSFTGRSGGYGDGTMPGIVGLAGIAFMADGNMPDEGPHGKVVSKALEYVLKSEQDSGLIPGGQMYGHGFATLFLAEAYGQAANDSRFETTDELRLKEKLQKAVALILKSQNSQGGWRYNPSPQDADISVTICQVMALRAARNAGITVPGSVIDKAIDYVKKSQEGDGGFAYMLNSRGSEFPRSAAGVACLYYLGEYGSKERENGIKYLMNQIPGSGQGRGGESHFFYGNYYATQAMFMAGGNAWEKYWPAIRKELLQRQSSNGSWNGDAGDVYATSMALIMLQVPNRLLPILQK